MANIIQHANGTGSGSAAITIVTPRGGTLLLLGVGLVDTGSTITVPSGFNAVGAAATSGTTSTSQLYYKTSDGSEGTTLNVSKSGTAGSMRAVMAELSGMILTSPLDQTATTASSGTVVTLALNSITPTYESSIVIALISVTSASNTWTSWTNGIFSIDNSLNDRLELGFMATSSLSSIGTTGTWSATGVSTGIMASFKANRSVLNGTGSGGSRVSAGDGMSTSEAAN